MLIGINCGMNVYAQQLISWNPLNEYQMEKPLSTGDVTCIRPQYLEAVGPYPVCYPSLAIFTFKILKQFSQ